jgi:Tol biopolymer transport system component
MTGHPSSGDFGLIGSGGNPALSPDGSQIVYSCESEWNDRVLCISSISGGNKSILVKIKREKIGDVNVQPSSAWSVDGQWVYFASAQDGDWDIYRIRPDGSGLENLTDHWGSSNEIMPAIKW